MSCEIGAVGLAAHLSEDERMTVFQMRDWGWPQWSVSWEISPWPLCLSIKESTHNADFRSKARRVTWISVEGEGAKSKLGAITT